VTGHFHDPAVQECRRIPLTDQVQSKVVADRERRFVVDSVVPVSGPG
jgi:hypothetical protein